MTRNTSAVAVCCSKASVSSRVRACSASNKRRVLDRDQRLVGEGRDKLDLLLGEWLHDGAISTMTPITTSSRNNGTPRMRAIAAAVACHA